MAWATVVINGCSFTVIDDNPGTTVEKVQSDPVAPCDFCGTEGPYSTNEKYGWRICGNRICQVASTYHIERVQACLVDCEETRRATLRWLEEKYK